MTLSGASKATEPTPPAAPAEPQPTRFSNGMTKEEMFRLSGELAATGRELRVGERIVVKVDGQALAEVTKEGPDRWNSFKSMVSDTATGAVRAANSAMQEDPSFTFREAIQVARDRVLKSDLEGLKEVTLKGLVPAARGIALMLDIYRARNTWQAEEATFIDKFIDGGHVVTDVAGFIGALPAVIPALQAVPGINGFLTAAMVGDIVAFGYHFLRWFQKTGNRPFPASDEKKPDPAPQPAPQPAPTPQTPQVRVQVGDVTTVIPVPASAKLLRMQAG